MSCDLDSGFDEADRALLIASSYMAEPFCAAWSLLCYRLVAPLDPEKFENCTTKVGEIATRALIALGAGCAGIFAYSMPVPVIGGLALLGMGSKLLRAIGCALQKGGYIHVRGSAPEKSLGLTDPHIKVMNWNICGIGGGMSLDHGGVVHWRYRVDRIVEKIRMEDPDVLILQEVYDTALAEALMYRLKEDFAHFYTHTGPNVLGCEGGCMVLTKCAVYHFSHTSFHNNSWTLNRGFESLEIKASPLDALPCIRIVGTHLIHGDALEDRRHRMEQVVQIAQHVARQRLALLTVLAGDLNMERDKEAGAFLSTYLEHSYTGSEPTCTNRLTAQWDFKERTVWEEMIDYISVFKATLSNNLVFENCHLVQAFDKAYKTATALSDHHGLAVVIKNFAK